MYFGFSHSLPVELDHIVVVVIVVLSHPIVLSFVKGRGGGSQTHRLDYADWRRISKTTRCFRIESDEMIGTRGEGGNGGEES